MPLRALILVALTTLIASAGDPLPTLKKLTSETKTRSSTWHGFVRHDFTLAKTKASARLVFPTKAAPGNPWIWRARFFGHQPDLDISLLKKGYHLGYVDVSNLYGNKTAMLRGDEFHQFLTKKIKLNQKPILEGMSRGGLFVFHFAANYPKHVGAIYGDNPVLDFTSWPGGLGSASRSSHNWSRCLHAHGLTQDQVQQFVQITHPDFAKKIAHIPIALVIGNLDPIVPPAENSDLLIQNLTNLKHPPKIWRKPKAQHHPHGLKPVQPLVNFLTKSTQERKIAISPSQPVTK